MALALRTAGWTALLCLAVGSRYALFALAWLPPLQRWHTERPQSEFSADRHAQTDFAGYLALEAALFDELRERIASWPASDPALAGSRFDPRSAVQRLAGGAPYNRSSRLTQREPRGQALLVHGLTDSPYAMRALAQSIELTRLRSNPFWPLIDADVDAVVGEDLAAPRR